MDIAKHTWSALGAPTPRNAAASARCHQTTAPALRIGDRVRVTNSGLQLLN